MNRLLLTLLLVSTFNLNAQTKTEKDIQDIKAELKAQSEALSNYNIEAYMKGYWQSDSLKFYGTNGIVYGYMNTLERYKKAYPTKDHTGSLTFTLISISKINHGAYYVMGEYYLKRKVGDANGIFMVVFKKIKGEWKIIADTSC